MRDEFRGPGDTGRFLEQRHFRETGRSGTREAMVGGGGGGGTGSGNARDRDDDEGRGRGRQEQATGGRGRGRAHTEAEGRGRPDPVTGVREYARAHVELPPAGGRGMLDEARWALVPIRTPAWSDDLVRALDERNRDRLRCLPPFWQRHITLTYGTDGEVRDLQKHVSGTIGGVRRLIFGGMSREEAQRLQDVAAGGVRVSYKPCDQFWAEGRCRYGVGCTHPHLRQEDEGRGDW